MKKLALSVAAIGLLFTACKKDDNKENGGGLGSNQFKVGTTTYNASSVTHSMGTITVAGASGTSGGGLFIGFSGDGLPTASGTFKIVASDDLDANDEISVDAAIGSGTSGTFYDSETNTTNPTAKVTVNGSNVQVEFTDLTVKETLGTATEKISANVTCAK
jgi:hypothetical protein